MSEDKKMFQIGSWALGVVVMILLVFQVCFRTQLGQLNRVRRDIVKTQQDIAVAEANFASYVRPESLRNTVIMITPKAEVISFQKAIAIDNLENKGDV
jgi:hypothetical protein